MSLIAFPAASADEPDAESTPSGFDEMPLFMSPIELAEILKVTTRTLTEWRRKKSGPRPVKFPASDLIRYTRPDVLAWLAKSMEDAGDTA